jgi:methylated-DNA-[protein]-cysteine S-methyltransferase
MKHMLTEFERKVLLETLRIPRGRTVTYEELARGIGHPKASRAVGNALNENPLPIIIPCHRIVGKKDIGGYAFGIKMKKKLLELEQSCSCC